MDLEQSIFSYDILGYKVKLSANDDQDRLSADEVVNMVREYTDRIKQQAPNLERGEVALLAALTLAKEKLSISKEYKESINELRSTANIALDLIEEVSPTTL